MDEVAEQQQDQNEGTQSEQLVSGIFSHFF